MRRCERILRGGAVLALGLGLGSSAGCHSSGGHRVKAAEPSLVTPIDGATGPVIEAPVAAGTPVTWVDRHPLFSKPRDYYERTDNNKFVKTAAAAVVGVPAGIFGELKQIVTGSTPAPTY